MAALAQPSGYGGRFSRSDGSWIMGVSLAYPEYAFDKGDTKGVGMPITFDPEDKLFPHEFHLRDTVENKHTARNHLNFKIFRMALGLSGAIPE